LHAAVADAIAGLDPVAVKEHAGYIADHLVKAGSFADRQRLVRWLILAGMAALDASAFDEAARSFRSALSQQNVIDQRARAELLEHLATAERGLERWDAVIGNLREALEIYISLDDREELYRVDRYSQLGWSLPGSYRNS
jgi:predicted ATPase